MPEKKKKERNESECSLTSLSFKHRSYFELAEVPVGCNIEDRSREESSEAVPLLLIVLIVVMSSRSGWSR